MDLEVLGLFEIDLQRIVLLSIDFDFDGSLSSAKDPEKQFVPTQLVRLYSLPIRDLFRPE